MEEPLLEEREETQAPVSGASLLERISNMVKRQSPVVACKKGGYDVDAPPTTFSITPPVEHNGREPLDSDLEESYLTPEDFSEKPRDAPSIDAESADDPMVDTGLTNPSDKRFKNITIIPAEGFCDDDGPGGTGSEALLETARGSTYLILCTLGLLLSSVGNSLYFKKMTNAMPNYGWYLSQVTSAVYLPVFGGLVASLYVAGRLSEEMLRFPKRRFALIGFLDSLAGICLFLGGVHTAGTTQVVLQQMSIPLTLALSITLLKIKYHCLQYSGAFIIFLGVMVTQSSGMFGHTNTQQSSDIPTFNAIFLFAAAPTALSTVYKETAFRSLPLDVNYLQFWVAVYQLIGGFVTAPINSLPILGAQKMEMSEIPSTLVAGTKCLFMGINTVTANCGGRDQHPCDECGTAWVPVAVYLTFNVFYNLSLMAVIKHGGATLSFLVSTLRLPLASIAFCSPLIMGSGAASLRLTDVLGLLILLLGLSVYRYGGYRAREDTTSEPPDTCQLVMFCPTVEAEPLFVRVHTSPRGTGRSIAEIRSQYYWKLSVSSPSSSPKYGGNPIGIESLSLPPSCGKSSASSVGSTSPSQHGLDNPSSSADFSSTSQASRSRGRVVTQSRRTPRRASPPHSPVEPRLSAHQDN